MRFVLELLLCLFVHAGVYVEYQMERGEAIDALRLYFIFMAAAVGCWRPAARPAALGRNRGDTLRVSLKAEQRSSC